MENCAIILAASEDDKMCTKDTKILLGLAGKPVVSWVKKVLDQVGIHEQMYIVSYRQEKVREELGEAVAFALQDTPLGTGHAVLQAEPFLYQREGATVVLAGDTPLIRPQTISGLLQSFEEEDCGALVLTAEVLDPTGYGRIIRDDQGQFIAIVEDQEADEEESKIQEVNSGIYCFDTELLYQAMGLIEEHEAGHFPLTDVIEIMVRQGIKVKTKNIDPLEFFKICSRKDLVLAAKELNERILDHLMSQGVTIMDPATIWIDDNVTIGMDTVILPGTRIKNGCVIGENCLIGPDTMLDFTYIGDNTIVDRTNSGQASIDRDCQIGPWVNLGGGVEIGAGTVIDSFVEIKNSHLGENCHIYPQTVINMAVIGEAVTIGAQVSFASDSGKAKSEIIIENHSFVGSQSCLIGPIRLMKNSYVAAGSVVTGDVPSNSLAIGRSNMEILKNWALRRR